MNNINYQKRCHVARHTSCTISSGGPGIRHSINLLLTGPGIIAVDNDFFLLGGNRSY